MMMMIFINFTIYTSTSWLWQTAEECVPVQLSFRAVKHRAKQEAKLSLG